MQKPGHGDVPPGVTRSGGAKGCAEEYESFGSRNSYGKVVGVQVEGLASYFVAPPFVACSTSFVK